MVCESCGELVDAGSSPTPFAVFGLEPSFALDPALLRARLLELARRVHPDFFAGEDVRRRELAEQASAQLNAAHQLLADEVRRADWLVTDLGGPRESEERAMPAEFLQEVLEWNEAIEEARESQPGSADRARLDPLGARLDEERAQRMREIAEKLSPLPARRAPALAETRKVLNAVRYLDRARREIRELRLALPSD